MISYIFIADARASVCYRFETSFIAQLVFFSLKKAMHRKYCRFVKKYAFESRSCFCKERRRKVKRRCAAQSKVSVDWLEITRSDLHSEICIAQKNGRLRETVGGGKGSTRDNSNARHISPAKTACRRSYTETIRRVVRKLIKRGASPTRQANISNVLYRRTIDTWPTNQFFSQ